MSLSRKPHGCLAVDAGKNADSLLDTMLTRRDMPVESDTGDTCHMLTNKLDSQIDDKTDDNTCWCAGDTTSA